MRGLYAYVAKFATIHPKNYLIFITFSNFWKPRREWNTKMSINKSEKGTNNIDDLIYPQQYVKKKATGIKH